MLTTRLDDDDCLEPDFVERLQAAVNGARAPEAFDFPHGHRILLGEEGKLVPSERYRNQFVSLVASVDRQMTVLDTQHKRIHELASVWGVDNQPAWFWIRHDDSLSQWGK